MKFKIFIAKLMCSAAVGRIIRFIYPSISFHGVRISTRTYNISNSSIASIFWGFYEKAEALFILKYLKSELDIIELGSSIGAISCLLGSKRKKNKLLCLEPGPGFIEDIKTNLLLNQQNNFEVIAKAYSYQNDVVPFYISQDNNIAGKVALNRQESDSILQISSISLKELIKEYNINTEYILVCDIEGMEVELFKNESHALLNCKQIIIETHTTEYDGIQFNPKSIATLIADHGFKFIDSYGPVYVFEK